MSDGTQNFCDMSLHFCNNDILFASPGTWPYGLRLLCLLWLWMVYEILACLTY